MDLIKEYCRADVELTRDIFVHGIENDYLLYERKGAGLVRLPVKWSLDEIITEAQEERDKALARRRHLRRKK